MPTIKAVRYFRFIKIGTGLACMAKIKALGFLAAVAAVFAAGTKVGIKYAQDHYVSKDRKFIEAEITRREKQKNG
jgi:hypothetical protein